jgi:hypothetical protein
MKTRCYNPRSPKYSTYGARGITVCPRWRNDLAAFVRDVKKLGPKPSSRHTLDRKDNDGPYAPWNIRWASPKEQRNNRQQPVRTFSFNGLTMSLSDWAKHLGLNRWTLFWRARRGWPVERILT